MRWSASVQIAEGLEVLVGTISDAEKRFRDHFLLYINIVESPGLNQRFPYVRSQGN